MYDEKFLGQLFTETVWYLEYVSFVLVFTLFSLKPPTTPNFEHNLIRGINFYAHHRFVHQNKVLAMDCRVASCNLISFSLPPFLKKKNNSRSAAVNNKCRLYSNICISTERALLTLNSNYPFILWNSHTFFSFNCTFLQWSEMANMFSVHLEHWIYWHYNQIFSWTSR